jgi:hypothetical protein
MLNGSRDLRLRGSMAAFGLSSDALLSQEGFPWRTAERRSGPGGLQGVFLVEV